MVHCDLDLKTWENMELLECEKISEECGGLLSLRIKSWHRMLTV
jgi:hypothetical protein